jgi:hypothetical protein
LADLTRADRAKSRYDRLPLSENIEDRRDAGVVLADQLRALGYRRLAKDRAKAAGDNAEQEEK